LKLFLSTQLLSEPLLSTQPLSKPALSKPVLKNLLKYPTLTSRSGYRALQAISCRTVTATAGAAILGMLGLCAAAVANPSPVMLAQVTYPTLVAGSTGETVSRLQATLKLLGFYQGDVDGNYSQSTQDAVAQFQTAAGIPADGVTGPTTWRNLLPEPTDIASGSEVPTSQPAAMPEAASPESSPAPSEPASQPASEEVVIANGPPILNANAQGSAVSQLQRELQALGYYDGQIDGTYGEVTQAAVRAFQSDQQLEVDAIVGPSTWDALTRALAE
jgi:N-acetylmuramoyl-L-alanine amidase